MNTIKLVVTSIMEEVASGVSRVMINEEHFVDVMQSNRANLSNWYHIKKMKTPGYVKRVPKLRSTLGRDPEGVKMNIFSIDGVIIYSFYKPTIDTVTGKQATEVLEDGRTVKVGKDYVFMNTDEAKKRLIALPSSFKLSDFKLSTPVTA